MPYKSINAKHCISMYVLEFLGKATPLTKHCKNA
jgi:hypothetical protein